MGDEQGPQYAALVLPHLWRAEDEAMGITVRAIVQCAVRTPWIATLRSGVVSRTPHD